MKNLGYGIPILKPCPTALTNSAALGDVGYMRDGEFVKLYNIKDFRKAGECEFQAKSGLFEPEQKGMRPIVSSGIKLQPSPADGYALIFVLPEYT